MENNLGKINAIFSQNINNILKKKDGKKIIKEYASKIKDNKTLLKEYLVFDYIENYRTDKHIKEHVLESINTYLGKTNKKELLKLNDELSKFMVENKIEQVFEIKNSELYENIHSLIFSKKNLKSINENIERVDKIVEFINKNNENIISEEIENNNDLKITENTDLFYKILIEKFNDKYSEHLSDSDKKTFYTLIENKDEEKPVLFEEYRKNCLSLTNKFLNEQIDQVTKEKLLNVKERLLEQSFEKETFVNDILSFIELRDTLSNIED